MKKAAPAKSEVNHELLARIDLRLKRLGKSARKACRDGRIDEGTINNIRQAKSGWPTGDILGGLAIGLECTTDYLIFGAVSDGVNSSLSGPIAPSDGGEVDPLDKGKGQMTQKRWALHDLVESLDEEALATAISMMQRVAAMGRRAGAPTNPQSRRGT